MAQTLRHPDDYKAYFSQENVGAAETGAVQGWWLVEHACPGIKTVVVHRPVHEIVQSMLEVDVSGVAQYERVSLTKHMEYGKRILDKISDRPGVLNVDFHDLKKMETCQKIFEHCLPYDFDVKWWGSLKNKNIQVNVKGVLRYYYAHKSEIDNFKRLCKHELRALRKQDPLNDLWKKDNS